MIYIETEEKIENETMETRVSLHPFFAGMKGTHLALLTDCAVSLHFKKGQIVFREGETANQFYVVEIGKVGLESASKYGKPVIVETIGAGELLGWPGMFPPYSWRFTARAMQDTDAIFFYGTILRNHGERDPSLGFELMKRVSVISNRRLQAARDEILSLHAKQATLQPVVLEPPFMDQEFDVESWDDDEQTFADGAEGVLSCLSNRGRRESQRPSEKCPTTRSEPARTTSTGS
jgi:CRP-like cAMP-binding protein